MIELQGVTKYFNGQLAVGQTDLIIQPGELVGIIGKSGAGKSTLLRCINLLTRPDTGEVKIDGQSLLSLDSEALREVRHQIGMVFQHFNLLASQTVYNNIALPLKTQKKTTAFIDSRVKELLALVGLGDKITAYPSELSGGQKQRVAIARALATQPKVLLCDEATSALDPETTEAILELLKKINHLYGITIVMITHDMNVVKKVCRRVIVMEAGRISEDFLITEVFFQPESLARQMLFQKLTPTLPACLSTHLIEQPNERPLLRLFFQGEAATIPFISQTSRELELNINILLANIDRVDTMSCGVLVVELKASKEALNRFIHRCEQAKLNVEVLGYVTDFVG